LAATTKAQHCVLAAATGVAQRFGVLGGQQFSLRSTP
jgi:hypothetical protein